MLHGGVVHGGVVPGLLALALLATPACTGSARSGSGPTAVAPAVQVGGLTEVVVIGTVHGRHKKSTRYSLEVLGDLLVRLSPDLLLVEIPPERWPRALEEHRRTGKVTEPRVRVFPEYVEVLLPLLSSGRLRTEVVGAAGWTQAMNDARKLKMAAYPRTRPREWAETDAAEKAADALLQKEGLEDDPAGIHTDRYDAIVRQGIAPYSRHFSQDLGAGGWENINAAHWALIAAGLDRVRGQGRRVVVTFGAWHKYWFRDRLRERRDVVELTLAEALRRPRPGRAVVQPGGRPVNAVNAVDAR